MENYDFDQIPLWKNKADNFEVLSDDISGRIPVTRIEHWKVFSKLLEDDFFNQPKTQLVFRGHRRYDWGLMPTLGRVTESGIVSQALAEKQLTHFKRAIRGRISDHTLVTDEQEDELWSVGQHHGLMTPLLDWTYSPYVALFFAFSKEDQEDEKENPYRAIYVLNKTFVADDERCPDIRMFEPQKDDHGRLVNQAGLFTFSPYDSTIENKLVDTLSDEDFDDEDLGNATDDEQAGIIAKYICKIYIKNEDREGCMRHLRRMNVHHASLFPDLIGASEYCNLLTAEEQFLYEQEQSAKRYVDELDNASITAESTPPYTKADHRMFIAESGEAPSIALILDSLTNHELEKGHIQLLAERIWKNVANNITLDWHDRESIQAEIRNKIRILLRKHNYPQALWEKAIEGIISRLITIANPELILNQPNTQVAEPA